MQALGNAQREKGRYGTVVAISGEIDISCSRGLLHVLESGMRLIDPHLALDLTGVTFIDCSGLTVLIRARRHVEGLGGSLRIVAASGHVKRIIALTGTQDLFLSRVGDTAGQAH